MPDSPPVDPKLDDAGETREPRPGWFPRAPAVVVALLGLSLSVWLWQALVTRDHDDLQRQLQSSVQQLRQLLMLALNDQILPLERLVWQRSQTMPEAIGNHLRRYPHCTRLTYVNLTTGVGERFSADGGRAAAAEDYTACGLATEGPEIVCAPERGDLDIVVSGTAQQSCVVGRYSLPQLLAKALIELDPGYEIAILDGDQTIFTRLGHGESLPAWSRTAIFNRYGCNWELVVWPTRARLAASRSTAARWTLLAGIIVSLLLATTVQLSQTSLRQTRELQRANETMRQEIAERESAEQAMLQLHQDLQIRSLQLISLTETAKEMNSSKSMVQTIQTMVDHARSIIGVHQAFGCLWLEGDPNPAAGCWSLSYKWTEFHQQVDSLDRSEMCLRGTVDNEPLRLTAEALTENTELVELNRLAGCPPMTGWLSAAVVDRSGSRLGLLHLSDKYSGQFDEEDEIVLVQLTQLAATAIQMQLAADDLEKQRQELARSNIELEQFAYVASHDLQEPLRKIIAFSERLDERYQSSLDERGRKYLSYIGDGATRMRRLIEDLLELSRVGRHGKPFVETKCAEVVSEACDNLERRIEETNARIVVGRMPVLMADGGQLVQLFQNLIGNAIKFHGDAPPLVQVDCTEQANEWLFKVKDNGIGIDRQFAERVFVIFQRLHTRSEYAGTGIGLAICRKIVERHGGRIWLESEPGKGTTFFFTVSKRHA